MTPRRRSPGKKPVPLGTDPALTLPASEGNALPLTYWDLWFALVVKMDFGSDLERLMDHFRDEKKSAIGFTRLAPERKLTHLRNLKERSAQAGIGVADIVGAAPELERRSGNFEQGP